MFSFINDLLHSRRVSLFLLITTCLALWLAGCGNGGRDGGEDSASLSAYQAANALVVRQHHPAALAVKVSVEQMDIQVVGEVTPGGNSVQVSDRFAVGSMTKAITATLAAVLIQEGLLDWHSRLLEVLPELAHTARDEYAEVTLEDLLSHRSGLFPATTPEQVAALPALEGTALEQRLALTQWALALPPTIAPRLASDYSNAGFVAASAMMERVTGLPYEVLVETKLFNGLGGSAAFGAIGSTGGPMGHSSTDGLHWQAYAPEDSEVAFPEFANPAGGALLRAQDLGLFLQLHLRALRGDQGLVLSPASARRLHQVVQDDYALGWMAGTDSRGKALRFHNGSDDLSYYALMAVSGSRPVAVAAVVNGYGPGTAAALSGVVDGLLK